VSIFFRSMCGIFVYLNYQVPKQRRDILLLFIEALGRLEYRGCDSVGLAVDADSVEHGSTIVYREVGRVEVLKQCVQLNASGLNMDRVLLTHLGIAHTRWATHGAPSPSNAHPQASSPKNEFLVVHNGIITNAAALRQFLTSKGFVFDSETDTEVIPKLCLYLHTEHEGRVSFPELVREVLLQVEGPFGVAIKSALYPQEVVAAKSGSPLYISKSSGFKGNLTEIEGLQHEAAASPSPRCGPDEFFISSDPAPLVTRGRQIQALEDGDLVHIKDGHLQVYNIRHRPESPTMPKAGVLTAMRQFLAATNLEMVMKGHHQHFMLKEIYEQPEALRNTMRGRVHFAPAAVKLGGIEEYKDLIPRARRVVIMALGSGYYGALAVRNTLEELIDVPISIELACDFPERRPPIFRDDVCIFVSFSGENLSVMEALRYCKSRHALCIGFTNVVGSPLALQTDCGVYLHAGYEVGVSCTKAFTNVIVALLMFALVVSEDNRQACPRREAIVRALHRLPHDVEAALETSATMEALAGEFSNRHNFLCLGRGNQTATCLQASLNLKETALVHSEGIHLGELKHGPLALVDEEMPVIVICTREDRGLERDTLYPKVKSSLQQILARHGRPIVIANADDDAEADAVWQEVYAKVVVPKTLDCLQTVINIVPLQLLAYHLAVRRGIDPDREVVYKS